MSSLVSFGVPYVRPCFHDKPTMTTSQNTWALAEASADKNHSQPPRACMAYTSWSSLEAPPCTLTSGKPASVSPRIPMNCGPLSPFNLVKTRDVTLKTSTFTLIHGYFKGNLGIPSSVDHDMHWHVTWRSTCRLLETAYPPAYRQTVIPSYPPKFIEKNGTAGRSLPLRKMRNLQSRCRLFVELQSRGWTVTRFCNIVAASFLICKITWSWPPWTPIVKYTKLLRSPAVPTNTSKISKIQPRGMNCRKSMLSQSVLSKFNSAAMLGLNVTKDVFLR